MRRIGIVLISCLLLLVCYVPISNAEWSDDPTENTAITTMSGEQALPKIAVDDAGYAYISWFSMEGSNYNVRLQRLDCYGNILWPENGVLVSDEIQDSWITDYDLAVDPSGYAVITFSDIRLGVSNPVAYRISPDGSMMWGATGVLLANDNNFDPSPKVCVTPEENSIFAWQSAPDSGDSTIRLQKVSPAGQKLWGDGILLSQSGVSLTSPYLMSAEGDYAFLIWHTQTGPYYAPDRGLYVQKLDTDGSFLWQSNVEIYAPVTSGAIVNLEMCRDDSGGIIFSWYRSIDVSHFHCYVQRMNADGSLGMAANGVLASTSTDRIHMYPAPAFLSETQEIVLFFSEQDTNQDMRGIYAQKFDLQGNRLWGDEGIQLIGLSNNDYALFSADGKDNQAICIYQAFEFGNYADAKMQAVMLDDQGDFVWQDHFIDLCTVQSQKLHNVMSTYNMGQWVAVWEDQRNDGGDIYAQNIQPDGTLGPVTNEPPIADFTWSPVNPTTEDMIQFTDLSYDPVGFLVNWSWTFDDGTSSYLQNPTHHYTDPGTYEVSLTVRDNEDVTGTVYKTVDVSSPGTGAILTLNITGGLGISIVTKNVGDTDAINVTTTLSITGGILHRINITRDGPFVSPLPPGEELTGKVYPLGVGSLIVSVTVDAANADPVTKTAEGFILFVFVLLK